MLGPQQLNVSPSTKAKASARSAATLRNSDSAFSSLLYIRMKSVVIIRMHPHDPVGGQLFGVHKAKIE